MILLVERNTCRHEETYRGGVLWEICNDCGAKWADDEGGKPEFKEPPELEEAYRVLGDNQPQTPDEDYGLDYGDLEIDTYQASGQGGFAINVKRGVQVKHKPTGLTARSESERSDYQNKKVAFAKLKEMLRTGQCTYHSGGIVGKDDPHKLLLKSEIPVILPRERLVPFTVQMAQQINGMNEIQDIERRVAELAAKNAKRIQYATMYDMSMEAFISMVSREQAMLELENESLRKRLDEAPVLPEGAEQVSSVWLKQLREEYLQFAAACERLTAENADLRRRLNEAQPTGAINDGKEDTES